MYDVILHHYDASPFSQKAIKMLALKDVKWGSVETPMIAPKPDLTALTGGYRGTPVLQVGADIYVDNARIAQELDARFAKSPLSDVTLALSDAAVCAWGESFFEAGLHMAINEYADQWSREFTADRTEVFARLSFDEVRHNYREACSALRVYAGQVDRQLSDGRDFLRGASVGMADLHAWPVLWFARNMAVTADLLADYGRLSAWERRVAAIGQGRRTQIDAAIAHDVARVARPRGKAAVDTRDPLDLAAGDAVAVEATFSNRGTSRGTLVGLDVHEIVVAPHKRDAAHVHVHFPRLGYRVTAR
jgi:glutathione S-transferase